MSGEVVESYRRARRDFYSWRYEAELVHKVGLAVGFAALTGLAAQVRLYLPFTPVPVTGQVFAVLLSAVVLGGTWGGLSQVVYTAVGAAWIPWFAPGEGEAIFSSGGLEVIFGATGGYIVGFVLAAFLIGWIVDSSVEARRARFLVPTFLLGVAVIYACGALWLAYGVGLGLERAFLLGVLPFIGVDVAKALGVSAVATALLPKERYGAERR
ncbi:MAG: hypothetical protein MAG715_00637 [Methanonatronarchaeales archaeon]|nr:hypothetical protein [Methanonatronarchaeales archaeon]